MTPKMIKPAPTEWRELACDSISRRWSTSNGSSA